MLLGIVGLNGSGKDTVAEYLVSHHNFIHRDLGQEVRNELKNLGRNPLDREEMIALANKMRKEHGSNYWAVRALSQMDVHANRVLSSVRNPAEALEIISHKGVLVEVFAQQSVRYARTVERVQHNNGAHGDVVSFDAFKEKEERELSNPDPTKQQLLACIALATYKINNNASMSELYPQIDALIKKFS